MDVHDYDELDVGAPPERALLLVPSMAFAGPPFYLDNRHRAAAPLRRRAIRPGLCTFSRLQPGSGRPRSGSRLLASGSALVAGAVAAGSSVTKEAAKSDAATALHGGPHLP